MKGNGLPVPKNNFYRLTLFISVVLIVTACFIPYEGLSFGANDYWSVFKKAESDLKTKNYQKALMGYEKVLPEFVKKGDKTNLALVYGRIAKCSAELGQYDKAAVNWRLEGTMWEKLGKLQDRLIANRKADAVTSEVKLFITSKAADAGRRFYHGAKFEPILGAYLGAYAENDRAVHDPYDPLKRYQDEFPKLTGKKHASYLLYFTYGKDIDAYRSHFEKAKETGTAIQLALQPLQGMKEVKNDEWLLSFVKKLDAYGVPVFLRFANEMNETSAPWYGPAKDYIPGFRLVSETVKKNSSNIVMVWSPAWFPPDTVDQYYPGDAYVDWVGLSMYKVPNPELDPLGKGVDRESYLKKLESIYKTYSSKKPVFISEGGISYSDIKTGKDTTKWAIDQMKRFYAYLPMLYPGIKGMYWFDSTKTVEGIPRSYLLSANDAVLNAYKSDIQEPFYLESIGSESIVYYKPLGTGETISSSSHELNAYVKTVDPDVAKIVYLIDNRSVGDSTLMPYRKTIDFSPWKGKKIKLTIRALHSSGKIMTEKHFNLSVK